MLNAVGRGKILLEEQVRAYDLYEMLSDDVSPFTPEVVGEFVRVYETNASELSDSFDSEALAEEAAEVLRPYQEALEDARFKAAAAASLHEFAKDTFEKWQTAGVFMRKRLLKELRERAGFRLERGRIGNYVARTFDLMNEGRLQFAKAQQALFKADMRYKIRQGLYYDIYRKLTEENQGMA